MLPAVAIGADMHAVPKQCIDAFDPGKFVHHPGRHQQVPRLQCPAVIGHDLKIPAAAPCTGHFGRQQRDRVVPAQLAAGFREQFRGWNAVPAHETVEGARTLIAVTAAVADGHAAHASAQDERGA